MIATILLLSCVILKAEAQTAANNPLIQVATDERASQDLSEPCDTDNFKENYDFIIVGAGAAGAVLANRLTEDPRITILLIEAGQPEPVITAPPNFAFNLRGSGVDWDFRTEPDPNYCLGMTNGSCLFPRGKAMGGSTTINNAIHTRGNKRDYDNWESLGNTGWDFASCLPYFKKMENVEIAAYRGDSEYHGFHGPLTVGTTFTPPLTPQIIAAGGARGWPVNIDFNGPRQVGFSPPQSIIRDGARLSSSRAYLHNIRHRKNLHVTKFSRVTRINFEGLNETSGVTFEKNGKEYRVKARKEVLLCAGTIQSPQLLMLSGIGPKQHLKDLGVSPIRANLPVGEGLQDHMAVAGIVFETQIPNSNATLQQLVDEWKMTRSGPLTYFGAVWALLDMTDPMNPDGWADIEVVFLFTDNNPEILKNVVGLTDETYSKLYPQPSEDHVLINTLPFLMRPKSRGRILLRDRNPYSKPLIYPGYWSDPDDIETVIKGIREIMAVMELMSVNVTLRNNRPERCLSEEYMSDDYIKCISRELTMTIYHYSGTCSMGTVVDDELKVKGIEWLRVVDTSVMPAITSGHTMSPTYMLAEKAADMIKQYWKIKTD